MILPPNMTLYYALSASLGLLSAVKSLCKILPNLAGEARDYNFETLHVCDKNIVKLIRAKSLTSCNSQSKCFQDFKYLEEKKKLKLRTCLHVSHGTLVPKEH